MNNQVKRIFELKFEIAWYSHPRIYQAFRGKAKMHGKSGDLFNGVSVIWGRNWVLYLYTLYYVYI